VTFAEPDVYFLYQSWAGCITSMFESEFPTGGTHPRSCALAVCTSATPLPLVELPPNRCKAASDMTARVAPLMIFKEVFDFSDDFKEP
jgi:hypothetical protein